MTNLSPPYKIPTYEEVLSMFIGEAEERDAYLRDIEYMQFLDTTARLFSSDPDEGESREIDQDGNERDDQPTMYDRFDYRFV